MKENVKRNESVKKMWNKQISKIPPKKDDKAQKLKTIKNSASRLQMMSKLDRTNRKRFMDRISEGENAQTVLGEASKLAFSRMKENVKRKK